MKKIIFIISFSILCFSSFATIYYVSPDGNDANSGLDYTPANAFLSWERGFNAASPGDTVYFMGGIYMSVDREVVNVSGTADNLIYYLAYPGQIPILDCSNHTGNSYNYGVKVASAQYLYFEGLHVRNVYQTTSPYHPSEGWNCETTANLTFVNCSAYNVSGRGWGISSGAWNPWDGADAVFTSDTTIWINCDAYELCDSLTTYLEDPTPGNAADGWKAHNYEHNYYYWYGCRAWNYSDDGFDPSGSGQRVIDNCWAMSSGKFISYAEALGYDLWESNGIKLTALGAGGYDYREADTIYYYEKLGIARNCLAIFNGSFGFYNNYGNKMNNGLYYNNTSYYNGFAHQGVDNDGGSLFEAQGNVYDTVTTIFRNNLFYNDLLYVYCGAAWYKESNNTFDRPVDGFGVTTDTVTVTEADFFYGLDSLGIVARFTADRNEDGSLPDNPLRLDPSSDLIDAGTQIPSGDQAGFTLTFSGAAPDIGAYEYNGSSPTPSSRRRIATSGGRPVVGLDGKKMILIE